MKAVDTTGAGDSFVGALLTAVAKEPSIFDVYLSLSLSDIYMHKKTLIFKTKVYYLVIVDTLFLLECHM